MKDRLNIQFINSLPQPFIAHFYGGSEWPVEMLCVETGLMHIDVCWKLDRTHIGDVKFFRDAEGVEHDSESFYTDTAPTQIDQPAMDAEPPRQLTKGEL